MSFGAAGGDSWFPGSAVPLGQGTDSVREEIAARSFAHEASVPPQGRGGNALDPEYFVSADDVGFGVDASGDDREILHGRLADDAARFPLDSGGILVAVGILCDRAKGVESENLETIDFVAADADGGGRGTHSDQHASGIGSPVRSQERLRANTEICN